MPVPTVSISKDGKSLIMSMPLANPETSKSGKMLLFGSTGGFVPTGLVDPNTNKPINMNVSVGVSSK